MFRNAVLNRPLFIRRHLALHFIDNAWETRFSIGSQRDSRSSSCTSATASTPPALSIVVSAAAIGSDAAEADIHGVAEVCHAAGAITKVILETSLLSDEEKVAGCLLSRAGGADFVKTSTGFSTGGATPRDIALMHHVVGDGLGVKASGGVRTLEDLRKLVAAGATRIGASASVKIMEQIKTGAAGKAGSGY